MRGTKIVTITFRGIKYIDSASFIPMPLDKFPKTFGLSELKKGFFPHKFNTPENKNYVGPYPVKEYYCSEYFSNSKKEEFDKWYEQQKDKVFDFRKEFHGYCWSDVLLLSEGCLCFIIINIFNSKKNPQDPGIDPMRTSVTLPAYCNVLFRRNHMTPDTLGNIPGFGLNPHQNTSIVCQTWLNFLQSLQPEIIQNAGNEFGEKRWQNYLFDGFCQNTKTIFEFHGCLWHGCQVCFSKTTWNQLKQAPQWVVYNKHTERMNKIKEFWIPRGYKVVEMWECVWRDMCKNDPLVVDFLHRNPIRKPLNPRESLSGGRTEGMVLYRQATGDEKIYHIDYTSLYPDRQKYGKYPTGSPKIVRFNLDYSMNYFGLIYCLVLPPRGLYIPVLPLKINNKLMFALCKTCAHNQQQETCMHTDYERALEGTWTTPEMDLALSKGYKIIEIYEVWNYEQSEMYDKETKSGGIFTSYINAQLKDKQEASGWPENIDTEEDKQRYIKDYEEHEGIKLDFAKIEKNPGRRSIAKLLCNSQWGYLALNCNKTKLKIIRNAHEWYEWLDKNEIIINHVDFNESENSCLFVYYTENTEIHEGNNNTNVILAAFVTSHARIKLYHELDRLRERVLYCDTDSIIYTTKPGEYQPELGEYLGEFTNEITNGAYYKEFLCLGPKNYATLTDNGHAEVTIKGINLNFTAEKIINFDSLKDILLNDNKKVLTCDQLLFTRDKADWTLKTQVIKKDYKLVFDKRVVNTETFQTFPYGF